MMITWCAAYTQPLKELVAQQHLFDQGFDVYFPRFKKIRRHARKVEKVLLPLFPRYIFVGMSLKTARWRSINGTRGVSYLLMNNDLKPACVPFQVIEELKSREISDGVVSIASLVAFTKGDNVQILEGVFKDQSAVFEALDDKSRVQLLLNFLGREVTVTFPVYTVKTA